MFAPLSMLLPAVAQGTGRTNVIAWSNLTNRILKFFVIIGLFTIEKLNVKTAIGSGLIIQVLIIGMYFLILNRIKLKNLIYNLWQIWKCEKEYGNAQTIGNQAPHQIVVIDKKEAEQAEPALPA